ncbi:MAG: hypothetical protein HQ523_06520 [Lentisphaerae bacterium]|nr:hypothetical protein [Lentisphaerota bacterium]
MMTELHIHTIIMRGLSDGVLLSIPVDGPANGARPADSRCRGVALYG